jgi:hypothetical protein
VLAGLERADEAKLERFLLDGFESGEPVEMTDEWIQKRRRVLADRISDRRGKKRA